MSAKIISAYPACGKSTYYREWSQYSPDNVWKRTGDGLDINGLPCGEKILDSDSSLFSWIYDKDGNKTDVRNPNFPNNYIQHIKDHMENEDVIFVSSHKSVRDALKENNIPYILIYPDKKMKCEWMERFKKRGNTETFINFQDEHWAEFIDDMDNEAYPTKIKLNNGYAMSAITVTIMNTLMDYQEYCKENS